LAKKRTQLDADEKQLLASVERGEWKSVGGTKRESRRYARYASATLRKDLLMNIRPTSGAVATPAERITPRLLNMRQAAAYLGCSFWTVRDYVLQGLIPIVDMPPLRAREGARQRQVLRRVLIDRAELDAVSGGCKTDRCGG
jgi:predicted site-specific integrase-resolvase